MTRYTIAIVAGLAALAAAGGYVLYRIGVARGMEMAANADAPAGRTADSTNATAPMRAGDIDPATGKRVLYWHDPMVPAQRFDQPGKSPFMNMQLVPVYEGSAGGSDGRDVIVSPRTQQNLGIRTSEVARQQLTPKVEAVGSVSFNERDQAVVQARAAGYVEKLHVRATFDRVTAGEPLADLYVPDWVATQQEFLAVQRMRRTDLAPLVDAARERMRQAGMTDAQIRDVEQAGEVKPRITLRAPIDGVVVELGSREGATAMPGDTLFRINGISTVWVNAEVPETQAALLRPGAGVEARTPAMPDASFAGVVGAILPDVDPQTRTIKARVELENPGSALAPGMFVNVIVAGPSIDTLVVPTEAVIETGRRTVVILAGSDGTFTPVDVEKGLEQDGQTEIRRGLTAGQEVVVSGQFLIDSEASLRAATTRMEQMSPANVATTEHFGEGRIESIDADSVTISHGPIQSIEWPSMTMRFSIPPDGPLGLEIGDDVRFAFMMGDDGNPHITRIEPIAETAQ